MKPYLNPKDDMLAENPLALVRDFKLKGATEPEIWHRVRRYRKSWPKVACTPDALLKHWDTFPAPQKTAKVETDTERMEREAKERDEVEWASLSSEERVQRDEAMRADLRKAFLRCA